MQSLSVHVHSFCVIANKETIETTYRRKSFQEIQFTVFETMHHRKAAYIMVARKQREQVSFPNEFILSDTLELCFPNILDATQSNQVEEINHHTAFSYFS